MAKQEDTTMTEVLTGFKSGEIIETMEAWLKSCDWSTRRDRTPQRPMSKYQVVAYVSVHYPDGASGFLDDMGAEAIL